MIKLAAAPASKCSARAMDRAAALLVSAIALLGVSSAAGAQNLIQNPGFELNPPTGFGNHIGYSILPWVITGGAQSNVVKVDGGATFNYGNSGPALDPDPATGVGVQQHYLDIAAGSNDFYQAFAVPACGGVLAGQTVQVSFSGAFSTRDNAAANASIRIRQGVGLTGTQLAIASVALPAPASSGSAPWTTASGTVNVAAGSTISYAVSMDNNANFDQASLAFTATTCPSALLTLRKSWTTAAVNDGATVTVTRGATVADSLVSVANTANETDTDPTPLTVYGGESLPLAETLNAGNAGLYNGVVACTGNGTVSGGAVVVGSTGGAVVCTYTNTRRSADLAITKTNTPANGVSDQATDTVASGAATSYQIRVTNNGVDAANGAVVRDPVPTGLTCTTATCGSAVNGAACPAATGTALLTALQSASGVAIPTLPASGSVTFTVSCTVQ